MATIRSGVKILSEVIKKNTHEGLHARSISHERQSSRSRQPSRWSTGPSDSSLHKQSSKLKDIKNKTSGNTNIQSRSDASKRESEDPSKSPRTEINKTINALQELMSDKKLIGSQTQQSSNSRTEASAKVLISDKFVEGWQVNDRKSEVLKYIVQKNVNQTSNKRENADQMLKKVTKHNDSGKNLNINEYFKNSKEITTTNFETVTVQAQKPFRSNYEENDIFDSKTHTKKLNIPDLKFDEASNEEPWSEKLTTPWNLVSKPKPSVLDTDHKHKETFLKPSLHEEPSNTISENKPEAKLNEKLSFSTEGQNKLLLFSSEIENNNFAREKKQENDDCQICSENVPAKLGNEFKSTTEIAVKEASDLTNTSLMSNPQFNSFLKSNNLATPITISSLPVNKSLFLNLVEFPHLKSGLLKQYHSCNALTFSNSDKLKPCQIRSCSSSCPIRPCDRKDKRLDPLPEPCTKIRRVCVPFKVKADFPKCKYVKMPGCKESVKPITCVKEKSKLPSGFCRKAQVPKPAFSECYRKLPPKLRMTECELQETLSCCDLYKDFHNYDACHPPDFDLYTTCVQRSPPKCQNKPVITCKEHEGILPPCPRPKPKEEETMCAVSKCRKMSGPPCPSNKCVRQFSTSAALKTQDDKSEKSDKKSCFKVPVCDKKQEAVTVKGVCKKIKLPGCKPTAKSVKCEDREIALIPCKKLEAPMPSFSECVKDRIPPIRMTECNLKKEIVCIDDSQSYHSYDACNPPDFFPKGKCPPKDVANDGSPASNIKKNDSLTSKFAPKGSQNSILCPSRSPGYIIRGYSTDHSFPLLFYSPGERYSTKPKDESNPQSDKSKCMKIPVCSSIASTKETVKGECKRISFPGCKVIKKIPFCEDREKVDKECIPIPAPIPSYSECIRDAIPPLRPVECPRKETLSCVDEAIHVYDACNPPEFLKKGKCPDKEDKIAEKKVIENSKILDSKKTKRVSGTLSSSSIAIKCPSVSNIFSNKTGMALTSRSNSILCKRSFSVVSIATLKTQYSNFNKKLFSDQKKSDRDCDDRTIKQVEEKDCSEEKPLINPCAEGTRKVKAVCVGRALAVPFVECPEPKKRAAFQCPPKVLRKRREKTPPPPPPAPPITWKVCPPRPQKKLHVMCEIEKKPPPPPPPKKCAKIIAAYVECPQPQKKSIPICKPFVIQKEVVLPPPGKCMNVRVKPFVECPPPPMRKIEDFCLEEKKVKSKDSCRGRSYKKSEKQGPCMTREYHTSPLETSYNNGNDSLDVDNLSSSIQNKLEGSNVKITSACSNNVSPSFFQQISHYVSAIKHRISSLYAKDDQNNTSGPYTPKHPHCTNKIRDPCEDMEKHKMPEAEKEKYLPIQPAQTPRRAPNKIPQKAAVNEELIKAIFLIENESSTNNVIETASDSYFKSLYSNIPKAQSKSMLPLLPTCCNPIFGHPAALNINKYDIKNYSTDSDSSCRYKKKEEKKEEEKSDCANLGWHKKVKKYPNQKHEKRLDEKDLDLCTDIAERAKQCKIENYKMPPHLKLKPVRPYHPIGRAPKPKFKTPSDKDSEKKK